MTAYPRLCVSSTGGGGGKTLLSLGLGRAFSRRGLLVKPFKKGPDYIDAAWLGAACGIAATNLDPFFLDGQAIRQLFVDAMAKWPPPGAQNRIAILEGNRGLFDGLDEFGTCSTAAIARELDCPILLCLNCRKSTRTMAAIIRGLCSFEEGLDFCGVVLNKVGSSRHARALRQAIERYTDLPVLGALPRLAANPMPERHMGLATKGAGIGQNVENVLDDLANLVEASANLETILALARKARPLAAERHPEKQVEVIPGKSASPDGIRARPAIGYVLDDALWFYYPENLEALSKAGANLVKLSLLDNSGANLNAWQNLDGLYLGGGFPEDLAGDISRSACLGMIRGMASNGVPVYAECGGLMILCAALKREGAIWPMAGVFPYDVEWATKPRGLGYVEAEVIRKNPFFSPGSQLKGHEFHYSRLLMPDGRHPFGLALSRGTGLIAPNGNAYDALLYKNVWGAYTHIFAPAIPDWARNFVAAARDHGFLA